MQFKPIDEFSLRHLFSSALGEKTLKLSYLGPILNSSGVPDTSPDGIVIDKRNGQNILRCEFKYSPCNHNEFSHNGQFDIAIIWKLKGISKEKLLEDLKKQNGCKEIIVLSSYLVFDKLKDYNQLSIDSIDSNHQLAVKTLALKTLNFATVYAAYIAAKTPDLEYNGGRMLDILKSKLPLEFSNIKPQGIGNVITAYTMSKPKLIKKNRKNFYQWNDDINPEAAASVLAEVIMVNFKRELPSKEVFEKLR